MKVEVDKFLIGFTFDFRIYPLLQIVADYVSSNLDGGLKFKNFGKKIGH